MENLEEGEKKNTVSDCKGELVDHVYTGPLKEQITECTLPLEEETAECTPLQGDSDDNTIENEETAPKLPEKKYKLKWRRLTKSKQEVLDDVETKMESSDDVDAVAVIPLAEDVCTQTHGEEYKGGSKIFRKLKSLTKSSARDEEEVHTDSLGEGDVEVDDNATKTHAERLTDQVATQTSPEEQEEEDDNEKNQKVKVKARKTKLKWKRFSWHVRNTAAEIDGDVKKNVDTAEQVGNTNGVEDVHSPAITTPDDDDEISDSDTTKIYEDTTLEKSDLTYVTQLVDINVEQFPETTNPFLSVNNEEEEKEEEAEEEMEVGSQAEQEDQTRPSAESKEEGEKTLDFILIDRFTEKPKDESFYLTKRALRMYQKAQLTQNQCQPCCTVM